MASRGKIILELALKKRRMQEDKQPNLVPETEISNNNQVATGHIDMDGGTFVNPLDKTTAAVDICLENDNCQNINEMDEGLQHELDISKPK